MQEARHKMVRNFLKRSTLALAVLLAVPTLGKAQDIYLASGGADLTWHGTATGQQAGVWMDIGAVSSDTRRDLVVGAPGTSGTAGTVYVIFGGPDRTGDLSLANADTIITSTEAGNRFGASTAAGNIRNVEGTTPRNLAVGAPGALSNRGAVYLFNAGFSNGATVAHTTAAFTVLGAVGDQLGTALATGDLDGDTYRELIIGAPGTAKVYIIKGGPSLTGTLDLSTTSLPSCAANADVNCYIDAPGIGLPGALIAGDVTGDGIYDLLIGSPSTNVVYLFPGVAGKMPPAATTSFTTPTGTDEAGTSIRILDIDDDGKNDLAIGAPGASPTGRTGAGEVFLFLGPVTTAGPLQLSSANVVFYGSAVGYRAGARMATGDINRDTPNDLVINESEAASGAGLLEIYYGRSRSTIGTLVGSQRVVDFATAGQANRRIFGDPATGGIRAVQVFEVTGEGARDIIVGVPAFDSNTGKLYFTISPKLRISSSAVSMTVNQDSTATSSSPIVVTNPSIVSIGWTASYPSNAPSDQRWVSASPSAGTVDSTHSNSFYIVASGAGLTPGVHTATLNVTSTTADLTMTLPITVTLTVTGATVAVDTPADGATVNNGFTISGWAIDTAAPSGTGVSQVQAYAYPASGSPIFLGTASYGSARSDVAAIYGSRFLNSGYTMTVSNLTPGASYQISVFAKSTVTNAFATSKSINVTIASTSPAPGPTPTDPNPTPPPNPNAPGPGGTCSAGAVPTASTRVALNRSGLFFGATNNGALKSGAQPATVTFSGGCGSWSISTTATWVDLTTTSGSGPGTFTVSVKPGTYPAGTFLSSTLTVTAPGVANSPITIPLQFRAYATTTDPFGAVDTPAENATGIVGSIGVTGWALDDIAVSQVTIWRDPMPGETASSNGKVFIGNAVQVDGARPDVDTAYSQPFDYQAGWGYLMLTNMLPNQGNGTFKLSMYADDVEGHRVLLGTRTITVDNLNATKPFGAIDTPTQGGTVSGTDFVNFGWVLTPQPNTVPTDGSTIMVYIDGVPVGRPTYNQYRTDIATLFPGRNNSNGAVGFYHLDTTTLSNGVHTIAWGVTDNVGNAEGIGSRYFTVLNGAAVSAITVERSSSTQSAMGQALQVRVAAASGDAAGQPASTVAALPLTDAPVYLRTGFDQTAPLEVIDRTAAGVSVVNVAELTRFQLTLGSPVTGEGDRYEGYVVANGRLEALPSGAFLDGQSGEFFWQPGVGFMGTYELVFVRVSGETRERIPVEVRITAR